MRWPLKSEGGASGAVEEEKFFDEWFACECVQDGFFAGKQKFVRYVNVFQEGAALKDLAEQGCFLLSR
jgi:hypothetical protein